MHEMSLMKEVLDIIQGDASKKGIQKLEKVELVVGEISNVMPDALMMAFEIFKEQNPQFILSSATLEIQKEVASAECYYCGEVYQPQDRIAICPICNQPTGKVITGETFQIISYEGS